MDSPTTNSDYFRTPRVASLQPPMSPNDLGAPATTDDDPAAINDMLSIIRLWAAEQTGLPSDFGDEVTITAMERQPAAHLSIDLERLRRALVAIDEPFEDGVPNTKRWTTQDLFTLVPVPALSFPANRRTEKSPIAGQEEVRACENCTGAGKTICKQCTGTRHVACDECHATGQVPCLRCGGAGAQVQGGESIAACALCQGRGTIPCKKCGHGGQIACPTCQGDGAVLCEKCLGHGKLKRSWKLTTDTWTDTRSVTRCPENWTVVPDWLLQDCDIVTSSEWEFADDPGLPNTIQQTLPTSLLLEVDRLCRAIVSNQERLNPSTERLAGLRLRVRGTYIFRVAYHYQGHPGVIVVGGSNNRVLHSQEPRPAQSVSRRFLNWLDRLLSKFGLGEPPSLSSDYVAAVKAGTSHVSDPRRLVPAIEDRGAVVTVTPEGYQIKISASTGSQENLYVVFDVRIGANRLKETVLSTVCRLGAAHRDRFPEALAMNHRLSVGQMAVVQDPQARDEYFAIVDHRPYATIHAAEYACILIDLSHEILKVRMERLLS